MYQYRGKDANFGQSGLSLKRFTVVIERAISLRSIPSETKPETCIGDTGIAEYSAARQIVFQ